MDSEIRDYPTTPTDYLPHVIARCIEKADRTHLPHRFSLNGATVVVSPGQSAAVVQEEVQRQWLAARSRAEETPPAG